MFCVVQYFIPILGMLLGNGISGVSVGLTALLEEFTVGARSLFENPAHGRDRPPISTHLMPALLPRNDWHHHMGRVFLKGTSRHTWVLDCRCAEDPDQGMEGVEVQRPVTCRR